MGRSKLRWDRDLEIYYLFWDGENHWLKIRPSTSDMNVAVITLYNPGLYSRFMSLHKGHGKDSFDLFVVVMAIVMLLTMISGMMVGLSLPKLRPIALYSMAAGTFLFFGLMF